MFAAQMSGDVVIFLWPTTLNVEPTAFTRFGRVVHWAAAIIAALVILGCVVAGALGVVAYYQNDLNRWGYSPGLNNATAALFIAIAAGVFCLLGRAVRYIFSGE